MISITSRSNEIFKLIKKLTSKSAREKHRKYILEGYKLIRDAASNGADIDFIIISSDYTGDIPENFRVYRFDKKLFDEIKDTKNSQGIIAVANMTDIDFYENEIKNCSFIVYLDAVSDPGNMGTIIRTCDGAGVDMIILSNDCTDLFSPKTIRSTMSSIFNVRILADKCQEKTINLLKDNGFQIVCTDLKADKFHYELDLNKKTVIVIGNEANGVNEGLLKCADVNTKIPIIGKCESLNAAVACGIMVYEVVRQRALE